MWTHRWPIDPMDMGKGPVDGPCWPWSLDCNLPFQLPITSFIHPSSLWDSRSCTYSRINRHAQDSKYPSWQVSQHFIAITWPNQRNLAQFAKSRKLVVKNCCWFFIEKCVCNCSHPKAEQKKLGPDSGLTPCQITISISSLSLSPAPRQIAISLPGLQSQMAISYSCHSSIWSSKHHGHWICSILSSSASCLCIFVSSKKVQVKEVLRLQHCNESCWTHWPLNFMSEK